jgi:hypothetical protein
MLCSMPRQSDHMIDRTARSAVPGGFEKAQSPAQRDLQNIKALANEVSL